MYDPPRQSSIPSPRHTLPIRPKNSFPNKLQLFGPHNRECQQQGVAKQRR